MAGLILGEPTNDVLGMVAYAVINIAACYFICKKNPSGIWYVAIITNFALIVSAVVEPNFWKSAL